MRRVYDVELGVGMMEMRATCTDGWAGPWHMTSPNGRVLVDADIARRKSALRVSGALGFAILTTAVIWFTALASAGIWLVLKVVGSW